MKLYLIVDGDDGDVTAATDLSKAEVGDFYYEVPADATITIHLSQLRDQAMIYELIEAQGFKPVEVGP